MCVFGLAVKLQLELPYPLPGGLGLYHGAWACTGGAWACSWLQLLAAAFCRQCTPWTAAGDGIATWVPAVSVGNLDCFVQRDEGRTYCHPWSLTRILLWPPLLGTPPAGGTQGRPGAALGWGGISPVEFIIPSYHGAERWMTAGMALVPGPGSLVHGQAQLGTWPGTSMAAS